MEWLHVRVVVGGQKALAENNCLESSYMITLIIINVIIIMMMFMIIIIMTNFVSRRNSSTFNRTSIETMCVSRTWLMNIHDMHRRRRKTPRRQQLQNRICNCNIEYVCNDDMIHTIIVISC